MTPISGLHGVAFSRAQHFVRFARSLATEESSRAFICRWWASSTPRSVARSRTWGVGVCPGSQVFHLHLEGVLPRSLGKKLHATARDTMSQSGRFSRK